MYFAFGREYDQIDLLKYDSANPHGSSYRYLQNSEVRGKSLTVLNAWVYVPRARTTRSGVLNALTTWAYNHGPHIQDTIDDDLDTWGFNTGGKGLYDCSVFAVKFAESIGTH